MGRVTGVFLATLFAVLAVGSADPAVSHGWDIEPDSSKDCAWVPYPGSEVTCEVQIRNIWPKADAKGHNDMVIVHVLDKPDPGLTWIGGEQLELNNPELPRIAPISTPDDMLVPGAVKVVTLLYKFRLDSDVPVGKTICNRVKIKATTTNKEGKPKYTKAESCVTVVAPPPPPPVEQPPVAQIPPPAVVLPPPVLGKPPAPMPRPKPKPKPKPCKTKTVPFKLTKWVKNDDPEPNVRTSSTDSTKKCRYADWHKHLRLKHTPKRAPFNPFETITFKVAGNGPFIDISYVKYWVEGERRDPVKWRAPYPFTLPSGKFGKLREPLNEWKKTNATGKVHLIPLTKYPS